MGVGGFAGRLSVFRMSLEERGHVCMLKLFQFLFIYLFILLVCLFLYDIRALALSSLLWEKKKRKEKKDWRPKTSCSIHHRG